MKTIGLLGGMSWESTQNYYRIINESVKTVLGGQHSAQIILYSVDFYEIELLQHQERWNELGKLLAEKAKSVERAGADCLLLCTNTMHNVASVIEKSVSIPLLHIADAAGESLVTQNIKKVGLLGTRFTMEQEFYKQRLKDKFNIDVVIPSQSGRQIVHDVIYNELCIGIINEDSKQKYLSIVNDLYEQGAEGVVLGCTEIAMLINQSDTDVTLFDTTEIHSKKAVSWSLS